MILLCRFGQNDILLSKSPSPGNSLGKISDSPFSPFPGEKNSHGEMEPLVAIVAKNRKRGHLCCSPTKTTMEPACKENVISLDSMIKPLMENVNASIHTLEADVNNVRMVITETNKINVNLVLALKMAQNFKQSMEVVFARSASMVTSVTSAKIITLGANVLNVKWDFSEQRITNVRNAVV